MTEDLRDRSFAIVRDFLPQSRVDVIREDLRSSRPNMKTAGIGKDRAIANTIRRDEVLWLDGNSPVQTELLMSMVELKDELNRALFLGLRSFEGHYAHYPTGGYYRRHIDRFRDDDARTVSLILYLNPDWQEDHGGKLRLFTAAGEVDVEPRAGTLVLFMSAEIEHEVLESYAPRMSFTGWFKT